MALSRRDFLKLAGATAVVSSSLSSGCAATSPTGEGRTSARAIDIHHHYIPLELIEEVKKNGKTLGVEYFPPKDAKDNPLRIQFPKGNRLNPDPRMAEVNNRLDAMTKGGVGIATVEVHTACVGYELDGQKIDYLPASMRAQAAVKPIYESLEGWSETTAGARSWAELPAQAVKYVRYIEELIGAPVAMLSTSPERLDTILVQDPFQD